MTLERAAELVSLLKGDAKIDLFIHFDRFFKLSEQGEVALEDFARMCGFGVASSAKIL